MIRNKLSMSQTTSIVTAQVFSLMYYACSVWLTPSINKKCLRTVESLHFRALRLILRDYKNKVSRLEVTEKTKRLPPDKWGKFAMASLFLNMTSNGHPHRLYQAASGNLYSKRRKPGYLYAFDSSKSRVGKQSTKNWVGMSLLPISTPWCNPSLSKDSIRVLLKQSYKV